MATIMKKFAFLLENLNSYGFSRLWANFGLEFSWNFA